MKTGWTVPVERVIAKYGGDRDSALRRAMFDLFSDVVARTPVDTGRLRANWVVSAGEPKADASDSTDEAEATKQVQSVLSIKLGGWVYLSNSLPYASTVEYGLYPDPPKGGAGKTRNGFSTQAPDGMVRVAVRDFRTRMMR